MTSNDTSFQEELPLLPIEQSQEEKKSNNDIVDIDSTKSDGEYSLFVAVCFSLNYSIGAGILGLPYEFYKSGYILSSILLIIVGLLTYITMMYVVDGIIRAEAITLLAQKHSIQRHKILLDPQYVKQALISNDISKEHIQSSFIIDKNGYQLSELIGIFGGLWWRLAYDVTFGISTLIALWGYNTLFAVSLARNFGINVLSSACNMESSSATSDCRSLYSLYVFIFFIWTLIVTLMDFRHQKILQITATTARIIIIILMVFTSIGLIYSSWTYNGDSFDYSSSQIIPNYGDNISSFKFEGMVYMIAVATFAYGSQFAVTDIITPLSYSDKNNSIKQHKLWSLSTAICCGLYILCGITISIYFGSNTESPCTLGWGGFMGFNYTDEQPIWAIIVSSFIILLPAIDIGSAFPLIATTLANTFHAILILVCELKKRNNNNDNDLNINNWYESKRIVMILKISICIICSSLALIEWNFELILIISGAFKLLATSIGPCILEWKSKQFINDICNINNNNNDIHKTSITKDWMSHYSWLIIITVVSLIAFIAIFVFL